MQVTAESEKVEIMFCLGSAAANNYGIDCNIVDEYIQVKIKIFTFNFFLRYLANRSKKGLWALILGTLKANMTMPDFQQPP